MIIVIVMKNEGQQEKEEAVLLPDLTDVEEATRAFISSEIFRRKY